MNFEDLILENMSFSTLLEADFIDERIFIFLE